MVPERDFVATPYQSPSLIGSCAAKFGIPRNFAPEEDNSFGYTNGLMSSLIDLTRCCLIRKGRSTADRIDLIGR